METLYTLAEVAIIVITVSIIIKAVFKRPIIKIITDWLAQFF